MEHVIDVRRFPGSRRHPQFAQPALRSSLASGGIAYTWLAALGGRRTPRADSRNTAWRNSSFRGYADYMETPEFAAALDELLRISDEARTAIMCSEALWWRCHRALISDFLRTRGVRVLHISDAGAPTEHPYTAAARLANGTLTYDPRAGEPARLRPPALQASLL